MGSFAYEAHGHFDTGEEALDRAVKLYWIRRYQRDIQDSNARVKAILAVATDRPVEQDNV